MPSFQTKRWYPASMVQRLTRHSSQQTWLLDQGSLTQKLRQQHPNLRVNIVSEGFAPMFYDEALALNTPLHHRAWVRQVQLISDQRALVYARTVIPQFSIHNPWWRIKHLGQKPLGEVLFNQVGLARSKFDFCHSHWLPEQPAYLARRCQFSQQSIPLLLTEVFLSAF
ncbi:chorismate lyase [Thiomicrospira microaerophila]|uniref:chorismate--pyruvate lyase family protein n=1 Tax=Thiomicrospira microaerophila TaxID=406020 RepID=UPI00200E34DE|nr:chorismate lyase [Thiomicrospira microaerophila]UQB42374.1 chorismate lyase [Thiomicrospira microaerophila]